jgi:hypothetical protein
MSVTGEGLQPADLLQVKERTMTLPNGLIVKVSEFHHPTLKVWLYNPKLPAKRGFAGLSFFPYDAQGEIEGTFHPKQAPTAVSYIDSREQQGTMYDVGTLDVQIAGKPYALRTMSYMRSIRRRCRCKVCHARDGFPSVAACSGVRRACRSTCGRPFVTVGSHGHFKSPGTLLG